jgi:transposase-like protein
MKRHVKCPWCLSLQTQRWGRRKIRKRYIQKFKCLACKHIFSTRITKGVLTYDDKIKLTKKHLEGRTSVRQIVRDTGHSKQTILRSIHEITSACVDTSWIAKNFKPNWGGCLAVDSTAIRVWDWSAKYFPHDKDDKKTMHKRYWIAGVDLETLDIPHHHLADEESMIDLKLFFEALKGNGYQLRGLVTDGNPDIVRAARMVFGPIPHQLCIRHFMKNLRIKLGQEIIPYEAYRDACQSILAGRRPKLLRVPRELFTYQTTKGLPRTNQQIENLFKQVKLRVKSIGQFHSYQTASDYLNAWSLYRRFTEFTDCRDKTKNHKTPLEIAGVDIKGLNYLSLKDHSKTNLFLDR